MGDDNEVVKRLRDELLRVEDQSRLSSRRFTLVFVALSLVTVSSIVYGFVQQVGAARNAEEALRQHDIRDKCALENQQLQLMVESARSSAEAAKEKEMRTRQELDLCKGKKP
jgi:hypothetical protein